ncbi:hypothetical protein L228DRAFT_158211 [Xylona heveae TC161]|uniref:Secreted protein n=1 Tax=Xylona heveae (strain CBS 132557 / TC161) TaxID=1328760 RepID=A0A165G3M8_XYLHT|nr:hypothetical protein L228DRAFT_158211 [Xylona heveae TC161]KZF21702.1 hypothetical protein L228DRAFT_158211 [Xylona heveae TC161]
MLVCSLLFCCSWVQSVRAAPTSRRCFGGVVRSSSSSSHTTRRATHLPPPLLRAFDCILQKGTLIFVYFSFLFIL